MEMMGEENNALLQNKKRKSDDVREFGGVDSAVKRQKQANLSIDMSKCSPVPHNFRPATPSPSSFFRPAKGKLPMLPVFTTPGGSKKVHALFNTITCALIKLIRCMLRLDGRKPADWW